MQNNYERLGVSPSATDEEIQDAYVKARAQRMAEAEGQDADAANRLEAELAALEQAYTAIMQARKRATAEQPTAETPAQEMVQAPAAKNSLAQTQPGDASVAQRVCPHCGEPNPLQATRCFHCGQQITRPCPHCGFAVELNKRICPRCEVVIPEYDRQRFAEAMAVEKQVDEDRRTAKARVEAQESVRRTNIRLGLLFWLIATLLGIGICVGLGILLVNLLESGL